MDGRQIVKIIDDRLAELGMTQKEFCAQLGIQSSAMSMWRKGSMPKPERLKQIEKCLGISFASLAYHLKWSEATTMREGGWSNPDTVHRIYTHLANQDANEDVKRMQDFFANG